MPHPIVRFAPSPTGAIHIGNARTALLNFLYSKKHHGEFILRFDDTDVERSKEEYAEAIEVEVEEAIGLCGGDVRAALRATLLANAFLESEVERLSAQVSAGFVRGPHSSPKVGKP